MPQLKLHGVYKVFLGENEPQEGVYLGKIRSLRRVLVRTRENDDGPVGTPRVYNFNLYELDEDELEIEYPVLARASTSKETALLEQILNSKGVIK